MKTSLRTVIAVVLFVLAMPTWAHVVVSPSKAGVGSWVPFNISVPNDKDLASTELKLVVPAGLEYVTPTLKQGWTVSVEKDSQGQVTAIVWSGTLPSEFRDDFTLSAHLPEEPVDLAWKAYQTYQGGEVVGWDVDPTDPSAKDQEALEKTGEGPFSATRCSTT